MPRLGFSLEQVRSFVAVADTGSITAAGRSLFLSQAAVTQQVRNFERALGLTLLERTGGRVRLTAAAAAVAAACRVALGSLESIDEAAVSARSLASGSLRVGATATAAAVYLPPLLALFVDRYPGIEVTVATVNLRDAVEGVHEASLECAIVEGPVAELELRQHPIAEDELVVVVASTHPLARAAGEPDLTGHRYLAREPGAAIELFAPEMLPAAHAGSPRMQLGQMDAVRSAVRAGLGYAVLPREVVASEVADGVLTVLQVPPLTRWITAIRRPSRGSPPLEEFWRIVEQVEGVPAGEASEPRPASTARPGPRPA